MTADASAAGEPEGADNRKESAGARKARASPRQMLQRKGELTHFTPSTRTILDGRSPRRGELFGVMGDETVNLICPRRLILS